jgi:hypothetical protein
MSKEVVGVILGLQKFIFPIFACGPLSLGINYIILIQGESSIDEYGRFVNPQFVGDT